MRNRSLVLMMMAAGLATALQAQDPHYGFGLSLMFPVGDFHSTTYGPTSAVDVSQTEEYDIGLGAQFTVSFPVDSKVALRLSLGGQVTNGTNTAPGYDDINLEHQLFSLGGEVQVFPGDGSAYRHQGTYLLGGLSADFETFDRSFGDPNWDVTETTHKSRIGGVMGIGHSFGYGGGARFTLEGVYHKTLTGNDTGSGDPPSTDFIKISLGFVF